MLSYFGWKSLGSIISLSDFKKIVLNSSVETLQELILFSKIIFVGELLSRISILRYSVTFELKIHFNKIKFFSVFFSTFNIRQCLHFWYFFGILSSTEKLTLRIANLNKWNFHDLLLCIDILFNIRKNCKILC